MEEYRLSRQDISAVLRRRKYHILIPLLALFAISVALAYGLPPHYRSTATILIEQQEIPPDLVRSTVTSYASERIQFISQRVLTYDNLLRLIGKYNLYPGVRDEDPATAVAGLRESITQEMISADVIDPKSGKPAKAMIAFTLSVDNSDAQTAQKLAEEMVNLYLSENKKLRTEKAAVTSVFLEQEASRLSREISTLEAKLAEFKRKNVTTLPTLMDLNMRLMERTETELANVDREIQTLQERAAYLESQLAQTEPMAPVYDDAGKKVLSPQERMKSLQAQYMQATALYSPDHPDVVRMRRELDALKKALGGAPAATDTTAGLAEQLTGAKSALKEAQDRYSEEHPDVVRLKRTVASLETAMREAAKQSASVPALPSVAPDNPTYLGIQTELKTVTIGLQGAQARRTQLRDQLAAYEQRLVQTPQVEQEFLELGRDYDNAKKKYAEISDKLSQARLAEDLEKESRGEQFSVIEPPRMPETPESPNRLAILFLGALISVGGGAGAAIAAEHLDRTVRGPAVVTAVLKVPPLAVIPYLQAEAETGRRKLGLFLVTLLVAMIAASALVLMHLYGPLPPNLLAAM